ncbi:MAG TPA: DUF4416 family protein [Deltaproteobacteria bacterium]|nr:DUF4416 family protein [Deltaproteobacteria bacterium]
MGTVRIPREVMLFCSIIYRDNRARPLSMLKEAFGTPCFESPGLAFDYTSYYEKEMGAPLHRIIVAFERLVARDALPEIKLMTNAMEEACREGGKRTVNLDPGYLSMENVCLATTKPYSHRIYLTRGIWAEVTLFYKDGSYQANPWTYPDYASDGLKQQFNTIRSIYRRRIACPAA